MPGISYGYPPTPLSCYRELDRYDWYYKRDDQYAKKGKAWDMFNTWGQQRLMVGRLVIVCQLFSIMSNCYIQIGVCLSGLKAAFDDAVGLFLQ